MPEFDSKNTCDKLCKECPFAKNSLRGFLADYTVEDFINMMSAEQLFPCHMLMTEEDMTQYEVAKSIVNGEMKLCRGYVESLIKSAKLPRYSQILKDEVARIKAEGVSDDSMSIFDFIKHHKIKGLDK